jgi:hypothetical protein
MNRRSYLVKVNTRGRGSIEALSLVDLNDGQALDHMVIRKDHNLSADRASGNMFRVRNLSAGSLRKGSRFWERRET